MTYTILRSGKMEAYELGIPGATVTVLEDGSHTRESLSIGLFRMPPNFVGPPVHTHPIHEESWYMLEGRLGFRAEDEVTELHPGDFALIPRETVHTFHTTDSPATWISTFTPKYFIDPMIEMGERIKKLLASGGELSMENVVRIHQEVAAVTFELTRWFSP